MKIDGRRAIGIILAIAAALYACISYLILPATWARIEHEPGLAKHTMLTATEQGIPGGPINVGLVGGRDDVVRAFHAAGWYPADPITLRTSVEIVGKCPLRSALREAECSRSKRIAVYWHSKLIRGVAVLTQASMVRSSARRVRSTRARNQEVACGTAIGLG